MAAVVLKDDRLTPRSKPISDGDSASEDEQLWRTLGQCTAWPFALAANTKLARLRRHTGMKHSISHCRRTLHRLSVRVIPSSPRTPPDILFKDKPPRLDRSASMVRHPRRERGAGRRPRCPGRGRRRLETLGIPVVLSVFRRSSSKCRRSRSPKKPSWLWCSPQPGRDLPSLAR
jgi:hypothetical protein